MNKKKTIIVLVTVGLVLSILVVVATKLSHQPSTETEYNLVQIEDTLVFKEDNKVDPLTLVSITRKSDEDEKTDEVTKASIEKGLTVTANPKEIDTSVLGETEVTFTVVDTENNDSTKDIKSTFTVISEDAPKFTLTSKKTTIAVGDKFDAEEFIKDDVDLKYVTEEPEANADGTYDEGWYTVESDVNVEKPGKYTVTYHAVGTNGVSTDVKLTVTVEKESESKDDDSEKQTASTSKTNTSSKTTTSSNSTSKKNSNSSSSSNKTNTTTSKNNNATASTSKPTATPAPQQSCHTVTHKAEGHYEQVVVDRKWVVDKAAWTEVVYDGTVTVCNGCKKEFDSYEAYVEHDNSYIGTEEEDRHGSYHSYDKSKPVQHDEQGHWEDVYGDKWVEDKAAWSEQVCG